METTELNDLEIALRSVVMETARQFAETFGTTPQFTEFEQAYYEYRNDAETQRALQAFQKQQLVFNARLMQNNVSDEDRQEMRVLQEQYYQQPCVLRFTKAQEELMALAQEVGNLLSNAVGLDYGASCKTGGCCG